jgi:5'(3')-deoxyribonucleotidase
VRRIKIALDSDGFLSNFAKGALKIVEEKTGRRYAEADITEFDFCKAIGLSKHERDEVWRAIGSRRGFVASLSPYPGARQGVRGLRELGDVFCVTQPLASNRWWKAERDAWLALHVGIDDVRHADDKSVYEADLFVDDRAVHVEAWAKAWPDGTAVLWRTLHNRTEVLPPGAHETDSWDDLHRFAREAALRSPAALRPQGQQEMSL